MAAPSEKGAQVDQTVSVWKVWLVLGLQGAGACLGGRCPTRGSGSPNPGRRGSSESLQPSPDSLSS